MVRSTRDSTSASEHSSKWIESSADPVSTSAEEGGGSRNRQQRAGPHAVESRRRRAAMRRGPPAPEQQAAVSGSHSRVHLSGATTSLSEGRSKSAVNDRPASGDRPRKSKTSLNDTGRSLNRSSGSSTKVRLAQGRSKSFAALDSGSMDSNLRRRRSGTLENVPDDSSLSSRVRLKRTGTLDDVFAVSVDVEHSDHEGARDTKPAPQRLTKAHLFSKSTPHGLSLTLSKRETSTEERSSSHSPQRQSTEKGRLSTGRAQGSQGASSTQTRSAAVSSGSAGNLSQVDLHRTKTNSATFGSAEVLSPLDAIRRKNSTSSSTSHGRSPNMQRRKQGIQYSPAWSSLPSSPALPVGDRLTALAPVPFHFQMDTDIDMGSNSSVAARQLAIDNDLGCLISLSEKSRAHEVRMLSTTILCGLSRKSAASSELCVSDQAWRALSELLQHWNEDVQLEAAWALAVFAAHDHLRAALMLHMSDKVLLGLLTSNNEQLQLHAALVISSMALDNELHDDLLGTYFEWSLVEAEQTCLPKLKSRIATFWANLALSEGCAALIAKRCRLILFEWLQSASQKQDMALARSVLNAIAGMLMAVSDDLIQLMLTSNDLAKELSEVWLWRNSASAKNAPGQARPEDFVELERVAAISLATCMPACDEQNIVQVLDTAVPRLFTLLHSSRDSDTLFFACNVVGAIVEFQDGKYCGELKARGGATSLRDVIRKSISGNSVNEARRVLKKLGDHPVASPTTPHQEAQKLEAAGAISTEQVSSTSGRKLPAIARVRSQRAGSVRGAGTTGFASEPGARSRSHISEVLLRLDMLTSGQIDSLVTAVEISSLRELALHAPSMQTVLAATGQEPGLATLVKMLRAKDKDLRQAVLCSLAALCHSNTANQNRVVEAGGLLPVSRLLSSKNVGAAAAQALAAIVWDNSESTAQLEQHTSDIFRRLVRMLTGNNSQETLRSSIVAVYALCSQSREAQAKLLELGALSPLERLVTGDAPTVIKTAAACALASMVSRHPAAQACLQTVDLAKATCGIMVDRTHVSLQSAMCELAVEWSRKDSKAQLLLMQADIVGALTSELMHASNCVGAPTTSALLLSTDKISSKKFLLAVNDGTRTNAGPRHDDAFVFNQLRLVCILCRKQKMRKHVSSSRELEHAVQALTKHRSAEIADLAQNAASALRGKKIDI